MKPDVSAYLCCPVFIKSLRERLGVTQKRLAELTGVSRRTVQDYEAGKARFPYSYQYLLESLASCKSNQPKGVA